MVDRVSIGEEPARPLASVSWAAHQAGISRSVAYTWARAGLLPGCVEMGGRYYVRAAPFLRWLDGRDAESNDAPADEELAGARAGRAAGGPAARGGA
jgi:Helix-turn-helix domain